MCIYIYLYIYIYIITRGKPRTINHLGMLIHMTHGYPFHFRWYWGSMPQPSELLGGSAEVKGTSCRIGPDGKAMELGDASLSVSLPPIRCKLSRKFNNTHTHIYIYIVLSHACIYHYMYIIIYIYMYAHSITLFLLGNWSLSFNLILLEQHHHGAGRRHRSCGFADVTPGVASPIYPGYPWNLDGYVGV